MTPLNRAQLLTEDDYLAKVREYGDEFDARRRMGAEAIRELLRNLDLDSERKPCAAKRSYRSEAKQRDRQAPEGARSFQNPASARMDDPRSAAGAAAGTASAGSAGWRPLRHVGPERPLSRVINRNNRLKRLLELKAPDIIVATKSACCRKRSTRCSTTVVAARP